MGTPDSTQGISPSAPSQAAQGSRETLPAEALANLSHDLNNALSVILTSSTGLLRRQPADPTAQRQLELVHRSALRIHDLSEQLTEALSIESGQIELKLALLDAGQMMQEAVEAARQLTAHRSLRLSAGPGPLWIRGDHVRLQGVFAHLLRSALSGTLDGEIDITLERRDAEACIRIHEGGPKATGPSVSEESLRFHPSETQRRSLARYVSQGVVLAHGGRLWIEAPDQHQSHGGSAYVVSLPICEHPAAARSS
jgi:signal transduction histidine kinase